MALRVMLGKLDAITGIVGDFGLWVGRGILGTGTNATIDDDGLAVTSSGVERVRVGDISGGAGTDFGLKVSNAGAEVIIDGTSRMFRISASGTITNTIGAGSDSSAANNWTDVTLTALGAYSATPAHQSFVSTTNVNTGERVIGHQWSGGWGWMSGQATPYGSQFRAQSYGGANMDVATLLDGSNQCIVRFGGINVGTGSVTWYCKYHVLSEAAI